MTDLSVKNRIIALLSFAFVAVGLSVRSALPFTLVFFLCMGPVVFFADKILNQEKIKERTLLAFFIFGACYQTFFQLFNRVHVSGKQLMIAAALAVFLAAVFAATDRKTFPYSVFSVPLLCLLDVRVASAYCILLLSFSIVSVQLGKVTNKKAKSKKKKRSDKNKVADTLSPFAVNMIAVAVSLCGIAFCVYSTIRAEYPNIESISFLLSQFKNTFGFTILLVYLLVKLIRSHLNVAASIITGFVLFAAATVFFTINYGWSVFSLFLVSANMFLGLVCLENEETINEIKADYHNHRYLFLIGLLCLLQ